MKDPLTNAAILTLAWLSVAAAQPASTPTSDTEPIASLSVAVDGPLLANFPVQLKLTIKNHGEIPMSYWCAGPGDYPSAYPFAATITDATGTTRKVPLHNGQGMEGSGTDYEITDTQSLPAAFDPLPPGTYRLRVLWIPRYFCAGDPETGRRAAAEVLTKLHGDDELSKGLSALGSRPFIIRVEENPAAVVAAEKQLLARAENDPFARHVAESYGISPDVTRWLRQLLGGPLWGLEAASRLQGVIRLPPGGAEILKHAAIKHCRPPVDEANANLLREISLVARNVGSDEALEVVAIIVSADVGPYASKMAFCDLTQFRQKKVEDVLLALAAKKGTPVYWDAVRELGIRGNPAALAPLLEALKDNDPARRADAAFALGGLKHIPAAHDALVAALNDSDPRVRERAKSALGLAPR